MAKLTTKARDKLPASKFGEPGKRAYPMPDRSHAANAKARASQAVNAGRMSKATEKKIADGWNPFTGPVMKQDGSQWLKDGEVADDKTLLGMNFYVKGVDDKLPQ